MARNILLIPSKTALHVTDPEENLSLYVSAVSWTSFFVHGIMAIRSPREGNYCLFIVTNQFLFKAAKKYLDTIYYTKRHGLFLFPQKIMHMRKLDTRTP